MTAALKKLEMQKKSADNELAYADKLLANAKTDQAKAKAEDLKAKATTKAEQVDDAARHGEDRRQDQARCCSRGKGCRQDDADQKGRHRQGRARRQARA